MAGGRDTRLPSDDTAGVGLPTDALHAPIGGVDVATAPGSGSDGTSLVPRRAPVLDGPGPTHRITTTPRLVVARPVVSTPDGPRTQTPRSGPGSPTSAHLLATLGAGTRRRPPKRQFMVRRAAALGVVIAVLAGGGVAAWAIVGSGSPSSAAGHRVAGSGAAVSGAVAARVARAHLVQDTTPVPRTGALAPPPRMPVPAPGTGSELSQVAAGVHAALPPLTEPGGGATLFPSHRLVAFYGAPSNPNLGVLGNAPPDKLWAQLNTAAAPYATPGVRVVPSYELITYTAEAAPGADGTFTSRLSDAEIGAYLQAVRAHGGMLILDIQPGLSHFLPDAETLAPWLSQPDVGLALDPEWEISPGQLPGQVFGHTTAAEINQVSAWLGRLTTAHHLPQKLLLVHQFLPSMVVDKPAVTAQRAVAVAFNMDGFGAPDKKAGDYQYLAGDPRWALGYKVFYTRDVPVQTPTAVLALRPAPNIVEYE